MKVIVINGPMGVGKTTVGRYIADRYPGTAFIDGDWCMDLHPFVGNQETRAMAADNILHMTGNYMKCSACNMVVLVWLMDDPQVCRKITEGLDALGAEVRSVTLTCDRENLIRRWKNDLGCEWRTDRWLDASLKSLQQFDSMENVIDTGGLPVDRIAEMIMAGKNVQAGEKTVDRIFETEHLVARKFRPEDAKRLYEIHAEENVRKWIPNESYEDCGEAGETALFFAECVDDHQLPYVLAVELKQTGELIGDTGINEVEGKPDEVEIGYVVGEQFSGNGYATELVKAMTEYAVSEFGTGVLYGRVMRGNDASVRVLEKNGYLFEKEEFGAEDDPYGNGMLVFKKAMTDTERGAEQ